MFINKSAWFAKNRDFQPRIATFRVKQLTQEWPLTKVTNLGKRLAREVGLGRSKTPPKQGPKVPKGVEIFRPLARHLRTNETKREVRATPGLHPGPLLPTGVAGGAGGAGGAAEVEVEVVSLRTVRPRPTKVAPRGSRAQQTGVAEVVGCPGVEAALRRRPCPGMPALRLPQIGRAHV